MNTLNRNLWPAIGCFLIANTLGIGVVSAQTAPSQPRKADPRFTVKEGTVDIRKLDIAVVIGPIGGCPVLLMTGCSSPGGPFSPLLGGLRPAGGGPSAVLGASVRYDR